jgi:hypothetical protein
MKIHDCIKKAGKALDKKDRDVLLKNLPKKVKSLGEQAGSEAVINDLISDLEMERAAVALDAEEKGVTIPESEREEEERIAREEQSELEQIIKDANAAEDAWRRLIPTNIENETNSVEPLETTGKKPLEWVSRNDAVAYARAYGFNQAEAFEAVEVDGKFQLRYKTNAKNKRWLTVKNNHGFITLAERDRIWLDWRKQIDDNPTIGKGRLILSLFDRTGNWSQPYVDAGYDVVQVDVDHPVWKMDVLSLDAETLIEYGWEDVHGIIAAPPCQHFSNACRGLWKVKDRDGRTKSGLELLDHLGGMVNWLLPDFHAIENPSQGRINKPDDFDPEQDFDLSTVEWLGEHALQFNPSPKAQSYGGGSMLIFQQRTYSLHRVARCGSKLHTARSRSKCDQ